MEVRQSKVIDFSKRMFEFQEMRKKEKPIFDFKDQDYIGVVRREGDTSPGVYQKLDFVTVIFKNNTIDEVLEWAGLDPATFSNDFYQSSYVGAGTGCGYLAFKMDFHHIQIEIKECFMYVLVQDETFFQQIVPEIRLQISGQGLDWLRYEGVDVEKLYRDENRLPEGAHFTRCDFAYDFINYRKDFVVELLDYCRKNQTPAQQLSCGKGGRSFKWDYCDVRKMIVWIGRRGSKRMLRVYDKRLEQSNFDTKCYIRKNPYGNPDSWIRIEWETHDEVAHKLVLDACPLEGILKELYTYYQFQDVENTTKQNRKPAEFWKNLFDWDFIKGTVQNINFTVVPRNPGTIAGFAAAVTRFFYYHQDNALYELWYQLEEYYNSIYKPSEDVSPALAQRRRGKFDSKLLEVAELRKLDVDKSLDITSNNMLYRGSDKALHCRIVIPDELKDISFKQLEMEFKALKEENKALKLALLEKATV